MRQVENKAQEANREQLTPELMAQMNLAEKLTFVKTTASEIIEAPEERFRKLLDLIQLCRDPKDVDVVMRAVRALCEVFCDILPGYRIREQKVAVAEDEKKDSQKGP